MLVAVKLVNSILRSEERIIMNNQAYENPCWGHNCEKYTSVDQLRTAVREVYEVKKDQILPYAFFLKELGLKKSTPQHWKTCRPLNLKILEDVETYCEESIFNGIKSKPELVFKYWELTRHKEDVVEPTKTEELLDTDLFGDSSEFKPEDK